MQHAVGLRRGADERVERVRFRGRVLRPSVLARGESGVVPRGVPATRRRLRRRAETIRARVGGDDVRCVRSPVNKRLSPIAPVGFNVDRVGPFQLTDELTFF